MQQSMAPWYLFNSIIREVNKTDIVLGHLLLEVIGKRLGEEKAQFDCFDKFYIRDFGNIWHQGYNKTQ